MVLDQNTLWFVIPVLSFLAIVVGHLVARRTGKESNETTSFTAITNALFKRAEQADEDILGLRAEIKEVRDLNAAQGVELEAVKTELDLERDSTKDLKRVNASLVRYISKLTRLWPQGTPVPEPDEAIS